jgi:hypothetical protein
MSESESTGVWCEGYELVLKREAEQSESQFWLHNKASALANKNNDYIQIPCIILQTVTGFLSATGGLVPPLALGAFSVFTGVLSTLLSYYKFSAKAEGHRVVAQLYMKIFKNIEVELALPVPQRTDPERLLKDVREKLARISEVAPDVPDSVITKYKKQFKDNPTSHPIITNGIDPIKIYKPSGFSLSLETPHVQPTRGEAAANSVPVQRQEHPADSGGAESV